MLERLLMLLASDIFWIGFAIGFVISMIVGFVIECMCIVAGRSDIDTWMEEDKEDGFNRSKCETEETRK